MRLLRLKITLVFAAFAARAAALWPKPQTFVAGTTPLRLSSDFSIVIGGTGSASQIQSPVDLQRSIDRALEQIKNDRLQRLNVDRGEGNRSEISQADVLSTLELVLTASTTNSISDEINKPYEDLDEAYELSLPHEPFSSQPSPGGKTVLLSANTTLGLARGLQTFTQLVYHLQSNEDGDEVNYIPNSPLHIFDKPAFLHRAFMLDTARNFYPVPDILRTLDTMASVKLNVLHWHATDSQSWPLFVPAFPDLSEFGAENGQVYTLGDIEKIVAYAGELGISVMLEIDMPGHTASIAESFPDYVACHDRRPWMQFSVEPPAGQLKLGNPEVLDFSQRLLKNVSSLFPSKYFSSGGDEINNACYEQDPATSAILASANSTINGLLQDFVDGTHYTLIGLGKTPVVWEELVLGRNLELANETIVLNWISSANVRAVVDKGYRIIHAASDYFYLDCGLGGWLGKNPSGNSWCDPFKTWSKIYSFDPFASLEPSQHDKVVGGEALVWSEQVDSANLDSIAWPRAAAAAEVFWSGGSIANGTRDVGEALPRLHDWRYRALNRGVRATPLQPHWCALRPGACDLE
ncbi:hypothetical protein JCM5353_003216 [Sporobolomyces roseus]